MKAYYDASRGLCAVEIVRRFRDGLGDDCIEARVTARKHPTYRYGDIIQGNHRSIVPRDKIWRRRFKTLILPYNWADYGLAQPALAA